MQAYGEPSYWDERYSHESGPFDWYQKYNALAPLLHLYIPLHHRVLVVGCGNSGSTPWSLIPLLSSDLSVFLHFSLVSFFFSWLQRSVKAWLMMVTKRLWTLIYRLWWSKLCSGSTVIVHSWNVSFVNFTTVFIIIVICLLMDRIHWIWRGLKLNFTYARCLYVCIQVKLQISRRLSEIQTLQ